LNQATGNLRPLLSVFSVKVVLCRKTGEVFKPEEARSPEAFQAYERGEGGFREEERRGGVFLFLNRELNAALLSGPWMKLHPGAQDSSLR